MNLADPHDPALQAEIREEKWDAKCEASPRCHQCKESLYPHDTYTELSGRLYCERCVKLGTHSTDSLEVLI